MQNEKPISTPLAIHFKLSKEMCPETQEEIDYMSKIPYSSVIGSLMYDMSAQDQILHMQWEL